MTAYFIDGQIFFLDDSSAEELANRKFTPPDPEAVKEFYRSEAECYCELLGTQVQENDCTQEGVARLNELYKQMMAERRLEEMIGMLGRVRQDAEGALANEQFEAIVLRRSGTKEEQG